MVSESHFLLDKDVEEIALEACGAQSWYAATDIIHRNSYTQALGKY
jgi:hypothetical protein